MSVVQLKAARDSSTSQVYVPPRSLVADGSLREPDLIEVPAQGLLYSATTFNGQAYGIVDLDCGARIQALLAAGTDRIGDRVIAKTGDTNNETRFSHE
ncbi:hypothetical protein [Paraburkholderia sp. MM5482-R1]|uniref:hypothetical protein n=1 Tax=unclassified Paraburkholderia TaxID=2615204 RepID=UPI003D22DF04